MEESDYFLNIMRIIKIGKKQFVLYSRLGYSGKGRKKCVLVNYEYVSMLFVNF